MASNTSTGTSILSTLATTAILPLLAGLEPQAIAYAGDVVAKGLRAKHPSANPALEADVTAGFTQIQTAIAATLAVVKAVKTVQADLTPATAKAA